MVELFGTDTRILALALLVLVPVLGLVRQKLVS
jgi:hypothetical protein